MIKHSNSWWGIKNTGEDITADILAIINNAEVFVLVCGYNFTFKTSAAARPFFDALVAQEANGIRILLILPPRLHGKYNPQPSIITHCMANNLPVILNHQNHSKWILTDKQLYYGSSNFTNASWKDRVEVISIHDHTNIGKGWAKDTITDFKNFIDKEIAGLNVRRRHMKDYRGLLTSTRAAWKSIKPMVLKFNPSIEKVVKTLGNYDNVVSILNEQIVYWFDFYEQSSFETIFTLSSKILSKLDNLCEYAYSEIYNESVEKDVQDIDKSIIEEYNTLYAGLIDTIDFSSQQLEVIIETEKDVVLDKFAGLNLQTINIFKQQFDAFFYEQ